MDQAYAQRMIATYGTRPRVVDTHRAGPTYIGATMVNPRLFPEQKLTEDWFFALVPDHARQIVPI